MNLSQFLVAVLSQCEGGTDNVVKVTRLQNPVGEQDEIEFMRKLSASCDEPTLFIMEEN